MEPAGQGRFERRVAANLAADVAGYSLLTEADEEETLRRLKTLRAEVFEGESPGPTVYCDHPRPPVLVSLRRLTRQKSVLGLVRV